MSNLIELTTDTTISGKPIVRKIKGYDCSHFHWTKDFGLVGSKCDLGKIYYKDCTFINNPRKCKNFICQKKLIGVEND